MAYTVTPKTIKFSQIEKDKKLTPSNYDLIPIKNENIKLIKELLIDYTIGKDVGSNHYLSFDSGFKFIKTKQ